MKPHPIHPNWDRPAAHMMDGYSLEMTAKDRSALDEAAHLITPDTPIAVTFLPGEAMDDRVAAAVRIRELGFEPMPHLSARRIFSEEELATMMKRLVAEAGVSAARSRSSRPVPAHRCSELSASRRPKDHDARLARQRAGACAVVRGCERPDDSA
jgi:methylenetetrahydrofolate reductase (NADPH)